VRSISGWAATGFSRSVARSGQKMVAHC
jgi:hypothetical protein